MTEVILVQVVFRWQFGLLEAIQIGLVLSGFGLLSEDVLQEVPIGGFAVLGVNDKLVQIVGDIGQAEPGAIFLDVVGVHAKMDL